MTSASAPQKSRRKDLGNFDGMWHSGLASHFRAAGSGYSTTEYNPLNAFRPDHLAAWIPHVMRYWFHKRHPFRDYATPGKGNGIFPMDDRVRLSVAGDWGTGTDEAQKVAECIEQFASDFTIHLGDVYFVGDETEVKENFLGERTSPYDPVRWPTGKRGSFALSGNHEMYARGNAYYNSILASMGLRDSASYWGSGQWASFFCLENKYWRFIGLDTAFNGIGFDWGRVPWLGNSKRLRKSVHLKPSCAMPPAQIEWLKSTVNPGADKRGLVLLTHHGCYSAFGEWYQIPARQLARVIERPVIWFWGHEHKLAIYDRYAAPQGIPAYGRCIGHAGMPVERGKPPDLDAPWLCWDNRRYHNDEDVDVGYNGHVNFALDGPEMHIEYLDLNGAVLVRESWRVDLASGALEGPHLEKVIRDSDVHFRDSSELKR